MQENLPTTSFAVLGLLSRGKMSGYDLVQFAQRTIGNFWTIAKSQVYGELARLERLGYVRGSDVRQERRPDKRTFTLTGEGRAALDAWLTSAGHEPDRIRSAFLVKVFFGDRMRPAAFAEMIDAYRERAGAAAGQLRRVASFLESDPDAAFMRATALLGLRINEAAQAWAEEVATTLPRRTVGKTRPPARPRRRKG